MSTGVWVGLGAPRHQRRGVRVGSGNPAGGAGGTPGFLTVGGRAEGPLRQVGLGGSGVTEVSGGARRGRSSEPNVQLGVGVWGHVGVREGQGGSQDTGSGWVSGAEFGGRGVAGPGGAGSEGPAPSHERPPAVGTRRRRRRPAAPGRGAPPGGRHEPAAAQGPPRVAPPRGGAAQGVRGHRGHPWDHRGGTQKPPKTTLLGRQYPWDHPQGTLGSLSTALGVHQPLRIPLAGPKEPQTHPWGNPRPLLLPRTSPNPSLHSWD